MDTKGSPPTLPLAIHRLRFDLTPESDFTPPRFTGSMLRGLLGHGLRKVLCLTQQATCTDCSLQTRCHYTEFFESPRKDNRTASRPHPWVLDREQPVPPRLSKGEALSFVITLIGKTGAQALPWLRPALQYAGRLGMGGRRVPFGVEGPWREKRPGNGRWEALDPENLPALATSPDTRPQLPAIPDLVHLCIQTPFRQKRQGHLVRPETLDVTLLLTALRRRLRDLLAEHGAPGYPLPELPPQPEHALLARELAWQELDRWSNRQQTRMKLGGVTGELTLDMRELAPWWPLLWFGQWLHIGKQTSMGLGQYRLFTSL